MKPLRPLPLWIAAVVPATVVGHWLTYVIAGVSMADGHHGWFVPVLEVSLAVFACVLAAVLGRMLARTVGKPSFWRIWPRMAAAQAFLFAVIETTEGTRLHGFGFFIQLAVALIAALALCVLGELLQTCAQVIYRAAYARRVTATAFVRREPLSLAVSLAALLGRHRFQRPPPLTASI
jgi:hypothetical protein